MSVLDSVSELVCLYVRIGQCVRVSVSVCPYRTVCQSMCVCMSVYDCVRVSVSVCPYMTVCQS